MNLGRILTILVALTAISSVGSKLANAMPITVDGSYSIGQTGSATITDLLANPFSINLDVGVPIPAMNFFTEFQSSASNVVDTITASFTFTLPSAGNGSNGATDTFDVTGNARHDSLVWNNSGQITVNFADGAILDITLANEVFNGTSGQYVGLTPTITFELMNGPTDPSAVPEPSTLALLGTALSGFGLIGRRRRNLRSNNHTPVLQIPGHRKSF